MATEDVRVFPFTANHSGMYHGRRWTARDGGDGRHEPVVKLEDATGVPHELTREEAFQLHDDMVRDRRAAEARQHEARVQVRSLVALTEEELLEAFSGLSLQDMCKLMRGLVVTIGTAG